MLFFICVCLQLENELTLDKLLDWTERQNGDADGYQSPFAKVQAGG